MITGRVNASGEAMILLKVQGPEGQTEEIAAVVDTGFNGWLTLPLDLVDTLRLPFRGSGRATLADGRETLFDTYEATLIWDGEPRPVSVHVSDSDPLVGMGLFYGCELTIQVVEGGRVTISRLS
jgi:clan AA aspartic protease